MKENLPKSKKHLDYESLNLQSKRILNRLVAYMEENELTEQEIFGPLILQSTVKTKSKTEKVEILRAQDFFTTLYDLEIVIKDEVKVNLARFLCIDETYMNSLMFKKIRRAIQDFKTSEGLRAIGVQKGKLPEELLQKTMAPANDLINSS